MDVTWSYYLVFPSLSLFSLPYDLLLLFMKYDGFVHNENLHVNLVSQDFIFHILIIRQACGFRQH